jgi:hypothetical protein
MLISILKNLFSKKDEFIPFDIPNSPPAEVGYPLVHHSLLIEKYKEQINQIQKSLNLTPEEWDRYIFPVIVKYADFVHLIPASESEHHSEIGGLFSHSLDVGIRILRNSEDTRPYDSPLNTESKELKLKKKKYWRVALFIAALYHDAGKPVSDVTIIDETGTKTWNPIKVTIYEWATNNNIKRYFLSWNSNRFGHHDSVNIVNSNILGEDLMDLIRSVDVNIYTEMTGAITNRNSETKIGERLRQADKESAQAYYKVHIPNKESYKSSIAIEDKLIDGMRELIHIEKWKINQNSARVWVFKEGVFIVWNKAADEIKSLLRNNNVPGIPGAPLTMINILIDKGIAIPYKAENRDFNLWPVAPDILIKADGTPITLKMIRLVSPSILFDIYDLPLPVAGNVGGVYSDPFVSDNNVDILEEPKQEIPTSYQEKEKINQEVKITQISERSDLDTDLGNLVNDYKSNEDTNDVSPEIGNQDLISKPSEDRQGNGSSLKKHLLDFPEILKTLLDCFDGNETENIFYENNCYYLKYPDAIGEKPGLKVRALGEAGIILPVKDKPMLFIHSVNNQKGILFANKVQSILGGFNKPNIVTSNVIIEKNIDTQDIKKPKPKPKPKLSPTPTPTQNKETPVKNNSENIQKEEPRNNITDQKGVLDRQKQDVDGDPFGDISSFWKVGNNKPKEDSALNEKGFVKYKEAKEIFESYINDLKENRKENENITFKNSEYRAAMKSRNVDPTIITSLLANKKKTFISDGKGVWTMKE